MLSHKDIGSHARGTIILEGVIGIHADQDWRVMTKGNRIIRNEFYHFISRSEG
jgi:hypothetical protein